MIEERLKYACTGYRDCCGDMIRRRDTVATRDGVGRVVWAGKKWWVRYQGRPAEALNKYPAAELRRVSEDGGIVGQYPLSKESIVPGQRDNENEHCPDIVHGIKRIASMGYINNGTMGQ